MTPRARDVERSRPPASMNDVEAPSAAERPSSGFNPIADAVDHIIALLSRQRPLAPTRYAISALLVLVVTLIRSVLPLPLSTIPYLLFIPAVFITSLMFGLGSGLITTGLSAFLAAWLFLGTPFNLELNLSEQVTTGLFVVFGVFISMVCDAVRRNARRQDTELRRYRALKAEADASALALRQLNETLENRVLERTAELESAQEALRQSQKMEALGQLTGGIAHDFNNLLAAISGNIELLQTRVAQGRVDAIDRHVLAAQEAANRAAALTYRLLAFARRQTLAPRPTDINQLVEGMREIIQSMMGPMVEVRVTLHDGLWPTRVDPHQLENALLNLCINARDAMPNGGQLTIETVNLAGADGEGGDPAAGDHVLLRVGDSGVGMAPEVRARAFEPFFTTKPIGQGTGLGLSMIYGFALQSGGRIDIVSAVGEGAHVSLRLPRHFGEIPPPPPPPAAIGAPPPARGWTVLVIDDESAVRTLVIEGLEAAGYQVHGAHDGPSGLAALRSNAAIDLLVTDLGLPGGLNGRQVAAAARRLRPSLKVLYLTGYAEIAPPVEGAPEPETPVLTKPFTLEALGQTVRQTLDAG